MTSFSAWAPDAGRVDVEVSGHVFPMSRAVGRPGWWAAEAPAPAGTDYALLLDGSQPLADPRSPRQPYGPDGASRTYDHRAFTWADTSWRGVPLTGAAIY
ncbi:MAG: malto-oligosyltrehalose trehalohydrolase, partial [Trebonia sp.]